MREEVRTEIVELKLSDLAPTENNPRQISKKDFDVLKKSIQDFPEMLKIREVVVDENNRILGGHQRVKALQANGVDTVTVKRVTGLTEEQKREFIIKDNIANGEWDMDILANEWDDLPLTDWGLDVDWQEEEQEVVEDEVPEVPEEPKAKLGDIYQLGEHRLMCGDSTKKEDVEALMGGVKADMVFTDPPYNALKSWKKSEARSETRLNPNDWFKNDCMTWEEYAVFLDNFFNNFTGHSIYVCCDFRIYPIILEAMSKTDYDLKHCIVWKKNIWGLGKRYRFQHELIVYGCKENAPFFGNRSQSDVWEIDVDRTTEHKTPKPVGVPYKAIQNSSEEHNSVLDLFGGSGSTLMACEQLNRKCYMMELDPHYVDLIIQRWENFTGEKAVKL